MNKELLNDPEWLRMMYWDEGLSSRDLAKIVDCSKSYVDKHMRKFNIPLRSRSEAVKLSFDTYPDRRRVSSETAKKQWDDSEFRKMMSDKAAKEMNENWKDPEFRKKVSETAKEHLTERWKNPEFRKLASDSNSRNAKENWKNPEYRNMMVRMNSGENHPHWRGGISIEPYTPEFNEEFREYVRGLNNKVCFLCDGISNGSRLDVHHIDYNKKNTTIENCMPLCRGCHVTTNFDRDVWQEFLEEEWFDFLFCKESGISMEGVVYAR